MWVGFLIFYVANVTNVANVYQSTFCRMPTMLIYVKIAAEYSIFRRPRKKKYAHRNYTRVRRRPQ